MTRGPSRMASTPLFADRDLVVLNKPSGLFCGHGNPELAGVLDELPELPGLPADVELLTVHKYEPAASGAVLFAVSKPAQQSLQVQFEEREASLTWLALVAGFVEEDGVVDTPLLYNKRDGRLAVSQHGRAHPARTAYHVVERVAGNTLLECRVEEGRDEQVRTHLASIGHPLTVDPRHGGGLEVKLSLYKPGYRASSRHDERPLISRLTLHASRVRFRHPRTGDFHEVEAPLPKDFRATLAQLSRL